MRNFVANTRILAQDMPCGSIDTLRGEVHPDGGGAVSRKPVEVKTDLSFDDALRHVLHAPKPSKGESDVPADKRKIPVPGREPLEATLIGFHPNVEEWSEYLLDDQTVIKLKPVVGEILKVDGQFDDEGNPVYVVKSQNFMVVNAPESERRSKS
jgi:hypothetical protein